MKKRYRFIKLDLALIIALISLVSILCDTSYSFQAIKWYSFKEGLDKASLEKKLLLVSITDTKRLSEKNNDQAKCRDYKEKVLPYDGSLNQYINEIFVPVVMDVSKTLTTQENKLLHNLKFVTGKIKLVRARVAGSAP